MSNILSSSSTRIKTGLVLLVGILVIGYIDSYSVMWVLFGALLAIALYEAQKLFSFENKYIYVVSAILWIMAYFHPTPEDLLFVVALIYASILAYTKELDKRFFVILLYPTAPFLFLFSLYTEFGIQVMLWLLVVVAATDVGAYFVGRSIGKTKFCQTSPNKTMEGVIGGVVVASVAGCFFSFGEMSIWTSLVISFVISVASIFGDLFESYLKREANVKDSGNLLPGHGGILDRTDGYLFAGIMMLILLRAFA